jgi:uncharacterized membrane protein
MQLLNKTWVRVVISLFVGSFTFEIIHIMTGDPNRPRTGNIMILVYAAIVYLVLRYFGRKYKDDNISTLK